MTRSELFDPWAPTPGPAVAEPAAAGWRRAAAIALGGVGSAAGVWSHGPQGQRGAVGLVILAASVGYLLVPGRSGPAGRVLGAVFGLAGLVLAATTIGRAPVALTAAAALTAHAALLGLPPRHTVRLGAQVAVPFLAGSAIVAWRQGPTWAAALLLLVAVAVVVLTEVRPDALRSTARLIDGAALGLGAAVVQVTTLFVASLVLYLPGLALSALDRLTGRRRGAWEEPSSVGNQTRDARFPFSSPPRRVVVRRHAVAATLVVAVALAVVVEVPRTDAPTEPAGVASSNDGGAPSSAPDGERSMADRKDDVAYSDRPAMAGVEFADQLQGETYDVDLVPDEATGYRLADSSGELVNVRGGTRVTSSSDCTGCPKATLWLAGGSLVFGIGQRDEHTIASSLVGEFAGRGIDLTVVNLGVPGWTLDQEQLDVRRRLDSGEEPPDLLLFLDGYNDVLATQMDLLFRDEVPSEPARLDPALADRLLDAGIEAFPAAEFGRLGADRYRATAAPFDTAMEARGIAVARAFQPDASSSSVQREGVESLDALPEDFYEVSQLDRVLGAAATTLADAGTSVDGRGVLDREEAPVFIDTSHVNESGAAVLAAWIAQVADEPISQSAS